LASLVIRVGILALGVVIGQIVLGLVVVSGGHHLIIGVVGHNLPIVVVIELAVELVHVPAEQDPLYLLGRLFCPVGSVPLLLFFSLN
jgi:hypothetical protein